MPISSSSSGEVSRSRRRTIGKANYQARGVLYLRGEARFANLLKLPEGANIGAAINAAMKAIHNAEGVAG